MATNKVRYTPEDRPDNVRYNEKSRYDEDVRYAENVRREENVRNTHSVHHAPNNRAISEVISDVKQELKDFVNTRLQMLRAEMTEKASAWKIAAPAIVVGLALLAVSFLLFTGLLVTVIAQAIHNNWAYPIAFAVVFVLYSLMGAAFAMYGVRTLKASGMAPERTLRVLKQDQVWLQTEARTQL